MQGRNMHHGKISTAVARELAGIVWSIAQQGLLLEKAT